MPTADSSASKEVVTAALLLVIGGKILSGRTKDQNIGYVAEYLTANAHGTQPLPEDHAIRSVSVPNKIPR